MKIISCHIENFGKLSDKTYEFSDGVNIICEENGAGKSTLAAFIRAVFYGFNGEGKRSETENERKRFKPWQGGVYGGEITFTAGEKTYIVTRLFGAKEKEDDFLLRDAKTELPVTDFSSAIGEELFGLDADSFMRTVFLSQNDCAVETTGSINAKLGNLAENTGDIETYEKVEKKLADAVNSLSPARKTGQIAKKKSIVARLKEEVRRIPILEKAIEDQKAVRDKLTDEKNELLKKQHSVKTKISEVEAYNDAKAKKDAYDALVEEYESRKKTYDEDRGFFPGKVPTIEAIDAAVIDAAKMQNIAGSGSVYEPENPHVAGFKDDDTLDRVIAGWEERSRIVHGLSVKKQTAEETARQVEEKERKLASWEKTVTERKTRMEERRKENAGKKVGLAKVAERDRILGAITIVFGLAALVAGLLVIRTNRLYGGSLLTAGGALAMLGLGLCVIALGRKREAGLLEEGEIEDHAAEEDLRSIAAERRNLSETKVRLDALNSEIATEETILVNRDAEIRTFAATNGLAFDETNMQNALAEFKNSVRLYRENAGRRAEMEKAESERAERIDNFLAEAGISKQRDLQQQVLELKEKAVAISKAKEELAQAEDRMHAFAEENKIDEIKEILSAHPEYAGISFDSLTEEMTDDGDRITAVTDAVADETGKLEELRSELDTLRQTQEELAAEEEELCCLEEKLKIIEATKMYLDEAKVSFTSRYMEPVKNGFNKYHDILSGITADDFVLDANMRLSAKEAGKPRDLKLLSQGRQDLLGICMRMALVDAMYEAEKPFVVMDDPFTNLDDEKVKSGFSLLDEISRDYQVIYFTCHKSRARRQA